MIEWIKTGSDFDQIQAKQDDLDILFFYGDFSDAAKRALTELEEFAKENDKTKIYGVDVAKNKDVHKHLGVKSVPTVVMMQKGKVSETIEGVQSAQYYARAFTGASPALRKASTGSDKSAAPRVVVYSTPTCPACNNAKAHFRRKGVRFRDVDVSRDQSAADAMVSRSGQMGVPQIDINGQLIVGFDQARIDRLLNI